MKMAEKRQLVIRTWSVFKSANYLASVASVGQELYIDQLVLTTLAEFRDTGGVLVA